MRHEDEVEPRSSSPERRPSYPARAMSVMSLAPWILAAACILAMASHLLSTAVVGVADNGDAWRVSVPAGIRPRAPRDDERARVVHREHRLVSSRFWAHPSSPAAVAYLSRALSRGSAYDLRQIAVVYLAMLTLAAAVALSRMRSGWCVAVVLVVLASPFYADWLASFYSDAAALVGLSTVLFALLPSWSEERAPSHERCIALVLGSLVLGFSSRAHVLLPSLVAMAWVTSAGRRGSSLRARVTLALLVAGAIAAPVHFELGRGHRFPEINRFHSVYRGIAQLAEAPAGVLAELDLPASSHARVGRSYFRDPVDRALDRRLARVTPVAVLVLYAKHPSAIRGALDRATRAIGGDPLSPLSHGASAGEQPSTRGSIRAMRARWIPDELFFATPALALALVSLRRRCAPFRVAVTFLSLVIASEIAAAILGDGTFSLVRHLLLASFATDVLFLLTSVLGVNELISSGQSAWPRQRSPTDGPRP